MKIAVQLFGHMRTFEKCFERLNEMLLSKYDCDIFIHTWDRLNHDFSDAEYKIEKSENNILYNKIVSLYHPKSIQIESQNVFSIKGYYNEKNSYTDDNPNPVGKLKLSSIKYMLYSMVSVNKLRKHFADKNHIHYDYILQIRPDIYLEQQVDIGQYENEFSYSDNSIINFAEYPVITIHQQRIEFCFTANDIVLLAKPKAMDKLFSSLSVFEKCYIDYPNIFKGYNCHPENSFKEVAILQGINFRYYVLPYKLIREIEEKSKINVDPKEFADGYYRAFNSRDFPVLQKRVSLLEKKVTRYRNYLKITVAVSLCLICGLMIVM
ncbi:hypothetical protein [Lonepinella sp. BR2474]|uniref:hypothetical protein n=1 Tax=Lonepinella sp. BR2474 TaxID=3434548 RepID=UPI003F6DA655